jgi:hypothetical protein
MKNVPLVVAEKTSYPQPHKHAGSELDADMGDEAVIVFYLENHFDELLEGGVSSPTTRAVMTVWRMVQEFNAESSSNRRKNLFLSLLSLLDSHANGLVLSPLCKECIEKQKLDNSFGEGALSVVEAEMLGLLQVSGLVQNYGSVSAAVRRGRDWVFGPSGALSKSDLEKRLQRYREVGPNILAQLASASREDLHLLIQILLPLLVVYNEPVAAELEAVFARLEVVDPLSAKALRRKAITMSFVRTHNPSDAAGASLQKAVSLFRAEGQQFLLFFFFYGCTKNVQRCCC